MKKLIILSLAVSLIIIAGCKKSAKEMLTGTWKLKSEEGVKLTPEDKQNTMIFTPEGVLTMKMGTESHSGKWMMGADDKSVKVIPPAGEGDTTLWNIESLDTKEFTFTAGEPKHKVTLEKQQ